MKGLPTGPRQGLWPFAAKRGFTLIELMAVIALIGIAAVMIVPEMKGSYEDAMLRSASRELVDVFQLAYSRAVSRNQPHRVRFDEASGRYVVEVRSKPARRGPEFRPLKELRGYDGKIDSRLQVRVRFRGETVEQAASITGDSQETSSSSPAQVLFYGDGTADAKEVWLQDRHGFGIVLIVNPVTSRVRVSQLARQ